MPEPTARRIYAKIKNWPAVAPAAFTAPLALELYAMAFDEGGEFPKEAFVKFMYENAREFYNPPPVESQITLRKSTTKIADEIAGIVPLLAGQDFPWQVIYQQQP